MSGDEADDCYSLPLPGLHEHFGQALSYEKTTAGTAALEQECAMDPAMAELKQHLMRHRISFCVFDSEYSSSSRVGRETFILGRGMTVYCLCGFVHVCV